ncbi:LysR substrate-binding domain-containing protein [Pseudomonas weihenstephanensis]|uniref:LysR substrate-binding domain-containing protein n=1 Tax=Pseudomonas weihenstephanensis TaxID=1608994 RepID=UPI000652E27E|nr:LysR substrate-binding domain-containing protein [Pseudomonas weihenstephanensis]KMN16338.1 LysR family transcriptional regulator [Pseudomonas weihenstephanensis]MBM1193176.1 LysR family transcriptional regulator [Pseudomonas weihenstephanensis]
MHVDLIDLRLFVNIVQAGNITAGARLSHLSLPAASARIRAIEASLGVELLQRSRRGISPTPAGQALAQHARLLLQQVERMNHDLSEYAQGFKGRVRLLCNTAALTEYLPELLADFVHQHPHISVDQHELTSLRITHALRQDAGDIGIISDAVDTQDLQTLAFRDDPLMLVIPLDHPLAQQHGLSFTATLSHAYVGLAAHSALAVYLEEQALHCGYRMQTRIRAEGFDGVLRMVARGAGLGIVPRATIERWQAPRTFKVVELNEPWADRKLLLCARSFAHLPAYAQALLKALSGL